MKRKGAEPKLRTGALMEILRGFVLFCAGHLVLLSMLECGLTFEIGTVRREFRRSVAWRALLVTIVLVPLIAVAVARAMPIPPLVALVLVLAAICPGQAMQVFASKQQGGSPRLALSLALVLSILCIVTIPLWIQILGHLFPVELHASAFELLKHLSLGLLLPFGAGLLFRQLWPGMADRLALIVEKLFYGALASAALLLLVVGGDQLLREVGSLALLAALLVLVPTAFVGWVAGGPDARDRTTVGIAALFGNPAIVLFVAQASFPHLQLTPTLLAYLLVRAIVMLLFTRWSRSRGQLPTSAVSA